MFCTHELQTYVKVPFENFDQMHIYRGKRYSIYICLDFHLRHLSFFQVKFVINYCRILTLSDKYDQNVIQYTVY